MLAYVLWWAEQQDEALEILTAASEQLADDPEFRLELAGVHQSRGDLDTAMDMVEAITPRDQKLMQQREMMAMSLAERLGEVDRARQAAERLFGLRLEHGGATQPGDRHATTGPVGHGGVGSVAGRASLGKSGRRPAASDGTVSGAGKDRPGPADRSPHPADDAISPVGNEYDGSQPAALQ